MKTFLHIAATFALAGTLTGVGAVSAQEDYADLSLEQMYVLALQKLDNEAQLNREFQEYMRPELKGMRLDIRQAREHTTNEMRQAREGTVSEMRQAREDTTSEIRQAWEDLGSEIRQTREELGSEIRQTREELGSEIRKLRGWLIAAFVTILVSPFVILGATWGMVRWAVKTILTNLHNPIDVASLGAAQKNGTATQATGQAPHLRE